MSGVKEVTRYYGGEKTVESKGCHPLRLQPAYKYIDRYWTDIIHEVFSIQKARDAAHHEVHKLLLDDRIERGLQLYRDEAIKELVVTDVDVRAVVEGKTGTYTVIFKNWRPERLTRYRWEMVKYLENLFYECSCPDHTINGHYKSNCSLACAHIAACCFKLMEFEGMPKFLVTPFEKQHGYLKSRPTELARVGGLPMKKFTPYLNVLLLTTYKGLPPSLALSIHREYNPGYGQGEYGKPVWITFDTPEKAEDVIGASVRGLADMLACRGVDSTTITESLQTLILGGHTPRYHYYSERMMMVKKRHGRNSPTHRGLMAAVKRDKKLTLGEKEELQGYG